MPSIAAKTTVECSDASWPVTDFKLEVVMDTNVEVPDAMRKTLIASMLQEAVAQNRFEFVALEEGESSPGELAGIAERWSIPDDLHMKSAKAAHRFLVAIAALSERGPAPTLAEVAEKAKLSMPPVYRFVDAETPAGAYLAPLVAVSKNGRAKVIDLTPLGRRVASLIRAGTLPS